MQPQEYAHVVARQTAALAAAAEGRLEAPVPWCPGWRVAELVDHLSEVQRFWCDVVENRRQRREDISPLRPPDGTDPVGWLAEGGERLAAALAAADPGEPVWTWASDQTAGFVQRRQAHEAAVHRWDGEKAVGEATPIDPALAADGLDEFFEVHIPMNDTVVTGDGESIAIVPSDAGDPWGVRLGPGGPKIRRGAAAGDAVLSGPAADLLLVMWRRLPVTTVRLNGDPAAWERLNAALDLG